MTAFVIYIKDFAQGDGSLKTVKTWNIEAHFCDERRFNFRSKHKSRWVATLYPKPRSPHIFLSRWPHMVIFINSIWYSWWLIRAQINLHAQTVTLLFLIQFRFRSKQKGECRKKSQLKIEHRLNARTWSELKLFLDFVADLVSHPLRRNCSRLGGLYTRPKELARLQAFQTFVCSEP